jgi:hypothetical protein
MKSIFEDTPRGRLGVMEGRQSEGGNLPFQGLGMDVGRLMNWKRHTAPGTTEKESAGTVELPLLARLD